MHVIGSIRTVGREACTPQSAARPTLNTHTGAVRTALSAI